jgi:hypothetical protein
LVISSARSYWRVELTSIRLSWHKARKADCEISMTLPLDYKITSETLWWGAFILAVIDTVFVTIVAWRIKPATFVHIKWLLVIMTTIFFCSLWVWGLTNFWDSVYSYVFPSWAHWIIPPIFGLLYAGISLLFWSFWRALGDDNSFIRRLDRNSK